MRSSSKLAIVPNHSSTDAAQADMALEQYTHAHAPHEDGQSRLIPWHNAIIALHGQNYSMQQIANFLEENGVKISSNGVWMYLSREREKLAPPLETLNSEMSDAELCRRNRWKTGTLLCGKDAGGVSVIRITAIGEDSILARHILQDETPVGEIAGREIPWALTQRNWRRFVSSGALRES